MKIRSWLLLSFLVLIVFTSRCPWWAQTACGPRCISDRTRPPDDLAGQINEENSRLAEEVLTHYGEQIVSLKADSLLSEIMWCCATTT
jgi:hypothetical protein